MVDTSVARAAGGRPDAGFPSPQCTEVLECIGEYHFIAMSKALRQEWYKHASNYALNWLSEQIGRKRVRLGAPAWSEEIPLLEAAQTLEGNGPEEVRKDLHLIALAMVHDRRVVSNDLRQRTLLGRIPEPPPQLRELMWASVMAGEALPWVKEGCPERDHLRVGYKST